MVFLRRDLIELQERGLLARTRGGAVSGDIIAECWARYESISYAEREREHVREKRAIAEMAAQLVSDGDCILVNGGTTSRHLAEALRGHQNLHVVTNGLTVAMEFARSQNAAVHLLSGTGRCVTKRPISILRRIEDVGGHQNSGLSAVIFPPMDGVNIRDHGIPFFVFFRGVVAVLSGRAFD